MLRGCCSISLDIFVGGGDGGHLNKRGLHANYHFHIDQQIHQSGVMELRQNSSPRSGGRGSGEVGCDQRRLQPGLGRRVRLRRPRAGGRAGLRCQQ